MTGQMWHRSNRADPRALPLADRHYNRQKIGSPQFVPPGRCLVLLTTDADALWVTSYPIAEYVLHAWAGAMVCSLFRREPHCPHLASDLVTAAAAATAAVWEPPPLGMVTFVDPAKTKRKRDPGRCFRRAGFEPVGYTKSGLVALRLPAEAFPPPMAARPAVAAGGQLDLWPDVDLPVPVRARPMADD